MGPIKLLRATLSNNYLETKLTKDNLVNFYVVCSCLTKFCVSFAGKVFHLDLDEVHEKMKWSIQRIAAPL